MDSSTHRTIGGVLPFGPNCLTAQVRDEELAVFTYRPNVSCATGILFVFDGLNRDAAGIRDKAVALAESAGLVTFAPLLDRDRFPKWRYQGAGVMRSGQVQPRELWTGPLIQSLCEWARERINQPMARVFLFGHSAGGQLLSRICAYSPLSGIARIVIANPSVYVAPSLNEFAPFGFGNIFSSTERVARLQVYLALPITIYLGQADTGDHHLAKSEEAMRQGPSRVARGRFIYKAGSEIAHRHGWAFNWQLIEVPGTAHSAREMLDSEQCCDALGLPRASAVRATVPLAHSRPELLPPGFRTR